MTTVGIDTHKSTLAACAVDSFGVAVAERTFANNPGGHEALVEWVRQTGAERVGLEGSGRYGAAAARTLAGAGLDIRDVPPHLSHRERIRTHRPGKSDPVDALAIARVCAREELPPVRRADRSEDIGLLLAARDQFVAEATQVRNRLSSARRLRLPSRPSGSPLGSWSPTSAKRRSCGSAAWIRGSDPESGWCAPSAPSDSRARDPARCAGGALANPPGPPGPPGPPERACPGRGSSRASSCGSSRWPSASHTAGHSGSHRSEAPLRKRQHPSFPLGRRLCHAFGHRPGSGEFRSDRSGPPQPWGQSPAQPSAPQRRDGPGRTPSACPGLCGTQALRGKDKARGHARSQAPPGSSRVPRPSYRRTRGAVGRLTR